MNLWFLPKLLENFLTPLGRLELLQKNIREDQGAPPHLVVDLVRAIWENIRQLEVGEKSLPDISRCFSLVSGLNRERFFLELFWFSVHFRWDPKDLLFGRFVSDIESYIFGFQVFSTKYIHPTVDFFRSTFRKQPVWRSLLWRSLLRRLGGTRKLIGCMGLIYLPLMNGWFFGLGNYTSPMDPLGYWFDPVWFSANYGVVQPAGNSWWVQKSDQVEMSLVISLGMQHCMHSGWLAGYLPSRVWEGLSLANLLKIANAPMR